MHAAGHSVHTWVIMHTIALTEIECSVDEPEPDAEPVEGLALPLETPLVDARRLGEGHVDNLEQGMGRKVYKSRELAGTGEWRGWRMCSRWCGQAVGG